MDKETKKRIGRRQGDAMEHAINAHNRGDRKGFEGAAKEVIRQGNALGFKATESNGQALFPGKVRRRSKPTIHEVSPRRGKSMVFFG